MDKLLNEARMVEGRFFQFGQLWKGIMENSNILNNEAQSLNNKLSKLNLEIDDLQTKKNKLDEQMCNTKINVETVIEKIKHFEHLQIHLDALNQRKHLLKEYTYEKGLELEEQTLQTKLDNLWKYFHDKNTKLDEEIKNLESKLANRKNLVSKMFDKECNKYKKSIEKLKEKNNLLEKKLILISKIQKD